jgi:hypothetical protein
MARKVKQYKEDELIDLFNLQRLVGNDEHPLMQEWTNTTATLHSGEQYLFDSITKNLARKIRSWNEETLKMNFIAFVLKLGHLEETERYKTFYESVLEATVEEHFLKVRADMMVASGVLETPKVPYFYFQEYKKLKDPKGDVTAQLLEAFLISQEKNQNNKPLYGCTVLGRDWEFYIMQQKTYCISKAYDCTDNEDLMQIIAILRKFTEILETRLLA